MEAGSEIDNVVVRVPLPESVSDTYSLWKQETKEKQHKLWNFAILKFLNDINFVRSMFFSFLWRFLHFCVSVKLRIGKCKAKTLREEERKLAKIGETGRKVLVFSSGSAIKAYNAIFIKNGLPTFDKAAPTQPCQVKQTCQNTVFCEKPTNGNVHTKD